MPQLMEKAFQLQERLEEVLKEEEATYQTATAAVVFVLHDLGAHLSYDNFIKYREGITRLLDNTLDTLEEELKDLHENGITE